MIVKIPEKRRDAISSFQALTAYITHEFDTASTNVSSVRSGFERLTRYMTRESVPDIISGLETEKTVGIEIGNLCTLASAAKEMQAVADKNIRVTDPVFHYILSWPEHERPSIPDMLSASRDSITALGMDEHQYIIAVHANTDNLHTHIQINRVHPESLKSKHIEWAQKTLHKAARELEIKYGWSHDNGIFNVVETDGIKRIVEGNKDKTEKNTTGKAAACEVWHDNISFESWCKNQPAAALKTHLPQARSWQDIHQVLNQFGLFLKDSGGGGMVVCTLPDNEGRQVRVKASKVFRFLKRKELEARFGDFKQPDVTVIEKQTENHIDSQKQSNHYKRDADKRQENRLARAEDRKKLRQQFHEEKDLNVSLKKMLLNKLLAWRKMEMVKINLDKKRKIRDIKNNSVLSINEKKLAHTLVSVQAESEIEKIRERAHLEKTLIEQQMPIKSWREWLTEEAEKGNQAALPALRGIIYREKRNEKKQEENNDACRIIGSVDSLKTFQISSQIYSKELSWKLHAGKLYFSNKKTGQFAFADNGLAITWERAMVDDDALKLSLLHAQKKWGNELIINGGDEQFILRLVKTANQMGINIIVPAGKQKVLMQEKPVNSVQHVGGYGKHR